MNILLIYPPFPDTFWSFKHALKFIRKKAAHPPLGLLTVAAMLPEGWHKRLVDVNVRKLTNKDLEWADYAFISGMIIQRDSAQKIIARCKDAGLKVVAGGPLFTSEYDHFDRVDHFVLNEAEVTLRPFLGDLQKNVAKRIYASSEFPDIEQTPIPLWKLADMKLYASMSIQFSRGCPYNCEFCNVTTLFGHRTRVKSTEKIIAELDSLYESGWRDQVFIVDDNFIGNKKHLKSTLLPALSQWQKDKIGLPFNTEASINLADDQELMQMIVAAGFDAVFIGIETPNEESLAECNKIQNKNRDMVESVKQIQRAGLQVQGGFIIGFDNDSPTIFQRQIDFIQKSGIVTAMVGLLQAPYGTRLYERMKKEGRLGDRLSGDNVDGSTNIVPRMGLDVLLEGYRNIMGHIYSPKNYYQRVKTFLKAYGTPQVKTAMNWPRIVAFVSSAIRLGILGTERFQYWRLILWTLLRRPNLLPLAVTLAIYGYHYRKICRLHIL